MNCSYCCWFFCLKFLPRGSFPDRHYTFSASKSLKTLMENIEIIPEKRVIFKILGKLKAGKSLLIFGT